MAKDLYILPLSLIYFKHIDRSNILYLNHLYSSIDKEFLINHLNLSHQKLHYILIFTYISITAIISFHHWTTQNYRHRGFYPIIRLFTFYMPYSTVTNSDCLFFIRYTAEDTIKWRFFLIKINFESTEKLNMKPKITGDYHVIPTTSSF